MRTTATLLFSLALATHLSAQEQDRDIWEPFRYFLGEWEGTGEGNNTTSRVRTQFKLVLDSQFIRVNNHSVAAPPEGDSVGEVHEDVGFISYDQSRDRYIFRQFHNEGFVNQYVLDSIAPDGRTLVFVTEAIEGISPGWGARTTYQIDSDHEFRIRFDLAPPEKDFSTCQQIQLKRLQD